MPESHSLKEKRRSVRSIVDRLRSRFPVSVAETGYQEAWQAAQIGIGAVSGDQTSARRIVESAVEYVHRNIHDAVVTGDEIDVVDLT